MTTEIAVANQLGIALATDSAVTITGSGHVKVFNTADKLFELSDRHPVAVMINGNMDCLGTPWEILIKNFRTSEGNSPRGSIEKWGRDFIAYIENCTPGAEEKPGGFIDRLIRREIEIIQSVVTRVVREFVFQTARGADHILTKGDLDIRKVLAIAIQVRHDDLSKEPVLPSLAGLNREEIQAKYVERIREQLERKFEGQKLTPEEVAALTGVIIDAMLRASESSSATGVVIAGYGTDDTFPALFSAEIDGRIAGKLRASKEKFSTIADCAHGGIVTSFAQTDVIERLLKGVDPRFVRRSADFIERALVDAMTKAFEATDKKKLTKRALGEREKLVREMAEATKDEYHTKAAEKIKENFSREFESMIAMMPKQELIELAEALVSITAIERKATVDEGTVGGPVDVALVTKHEGFVWIKRKHYFPSELNPRFFWRRFGTIPQGSSKP